MSDQANPAAGSADRLQQLKLNTGPCSSCQCGFCATLSGIRAGPASHMTDDGIADGDKGLVGTGTGTRSLDIGHLSLAREEDGNGECSDWCFRRLIPCTVAARVTIGHNRERVRQRAEGRDHDSPQKDEDRSQGTQEPSLSLHLDRHVGQKTPACILTHRHRAGQGRAWQGAGSRDPEFRTQRIPPKTKGTQSKPQAARATQQIEADSPPIDSVDSAHMRTRLGSIQPMIPGCHTVYINHMGRTHARPDRQTDGIWGLLEMLGCREALGWPTSAHFSRILLQVCSLAIGHWAWCCALFRLFCRASSRFAVLSVLTCCFPCPAWRPVPVMASKCGSIVVLCPEPHRTRGMKKP